MINKTQNKVVVLTQAQFDAKYQADTLQENTEYKIIGDVPELPIPTTADNGKALTVNSSGKYALSDAITNKEDSSNKVTTLTAQSTDTQYPSAKCVYDLIGNVETLLEELL